VIVGGGYNLASGNFSFIGGGGRDGTGSTAAGTDTNRDHRAYGKWSFIGGGTGNVAGVNGSGDSIVGSTVAGGMKNTASGVQASIGGGSCNAATGSNSTIAGGGFLQSSNPANACDFGNVASGAYSFVGSGYANTASGFGAVVLGVSGRATASNMFVFSGYSSGTTASPAYSPSNGAGSFNIGAPGDVHLNTDTNLRFGSQVRQNITLWGNPDVAGGSYGIGIQAATQYYRVDGATTTGSGFSWFRGGIHSDTPNDPGSGGIRVMALSRDGQLVMPQVLQQQIRIGDDAFGGDVMGIGAQNYTTYVRVPNTGAFGIYLNGTHVTTEATAGTGGEILAGFFKAGTGSFMEGRAVTGTLRLSTVVQTSDRDAKTSFLPVNAREVLAKVAALPITSWIYKHEAGANIRHIGPVAQDFRKAFQVGLDDKTITSVDADGVALAAIKGLNELVKEKDKQITALTERLRAIEKRLGLK
jgi:hypothetical protein